MTDNLLFKVFLPLLTVIFALGGTKEYVFGYLNGEKFLPLNENLANLNPLGGWTYEYQLNETEYFEVSKVFIGTSILGGASIHANFRHNLTWLDLKHAWVEFNYDHAVRIFDATSNRATKKYTLDKLYLFGYFSGLQNKAIVKFLSNEKDYVLYGPFRGETPLNYGCLCAAGIFSALSVLAWFI